MLMLPWFDYVLWALSFALSGAATFFVFSRHRSIWQLWGLLAWWTVGNLIQLAASFFGLHAYALAYFAVELPLLALEAVLAVQLVAVLLKEHRLGLWLLSATSVLFIAYRHHSLLLNVLEILKTEILTCGGLGVVLALGYFGTAELLNKEVEEPWPLVIAGLSLLLTCQVVGFGLRAHYGLKHWEVISRVQPIGEILALGLWMWAAFQKAPAKWTVRVPLEKKKPVSHVWGEFEQRRVM